MVLTNNQPVRLLLLSILCASLFSSLLNSEPQRLQAAGRNYKGEQIRIGAAVYATNCASCHGSRGEGIGHLGPALSDMHFFTERISEVGWLLDLPDYIRATTSHGRMMGTRPIYAGNGKSAVMVPWALQYGGPLGPHEINAVTDFVMNWRASALGEVILPTIVMPPPDLGAPELVAAGKAVFSAHCARCHDAVTGRQDGSKAAGPALDDIPMRATQRVAELNDNAKEHAQEVTEAADYLRQSVLIPEAYVVAGFEEQAASKDQGCGAVISESQLQAVTAFLLHQND